MRTTTLIATRTSKNENYKGCLYFPKGKCMGQNVRQFDALVYGVPVEVAEGKKVVTPDRWDKLLDKLLAVEKKETSSLEGLIFEKILFRGVTFEGHAFYDCQFINCQFDGCVINIRWQDIKVNDCDFNGCIFKESLYLEANNCTFLVCDFTHSGIYQTVIRDCWFLKCNFTTSRLKHVTFYKCILVRPSFVASHFDAVYFRGCDITDAVYDSLYVTMGGATTDEVEMHRESALKALSGAII